MTSGAKTALFVGIAAILLIVIMSSRKPTKVTGASSTASNVDSIFQFGTALVSAGGKIMAGSSVPSADDTDTSAIEAGHFGVDYSKEV